MPRPASRADGTRANTDIVQPDGTSTWRGTSSGAAASPSGTVSVTGARSAGAAADGAPEDAGPDGPAAQAASKAATAASIGTMRRDVI